MPGGRSAKLRMASMVGEALAHHEAKVAAVMVEGTEETVQAVDRGSPWATGTCRRCGKLGHWAQEEQVILVQKEEEASLLLESSSKPLHSVRRVHWKIPKSGH
jgi:hypothetical protein